MSAAKLQNPEINIDFTAKDPKEFLEIFLFENDPEDFKGRFLIGNFSENAIGLCLSEINEFKDSQDFKSFLQELRSKKQRHLLISPYRQYIDFCMLNTESDIAVIYNSQDKSLNYFLESKLSADIPEITDEELILKILKYALNSIK